MSEANTPVAILVRVSTNKQETNRQINELRSYADSKGYEIIEIAEEIISGRADDDERRGLKRVVELAQTGKIKKVLVHEVSRLARKNSVAHKFVETLEECGVSLYWHAQGIETLLANGKRNQAAGIMLALLAESPCRPSTNPGHVEPQKLVMIFQPGCKVVAATTSRQPAW